MRPLASRATVTRREKKMTYFQKSRRRLGIVPASVG
jgi:hypothetical protein